MKNITLLIFAVILTACNTQQTYYDADLAVASDNERDGKFQDAEANLARAVWRAKNHLGPKEISTAYYNLGSFNRRQGQFEKSVFSLLESIDYAKKSGTFDELAMGRRYIEISIAYAAQEKWELGVPYIKNVVPIWSKYAGNELECVRSVFSEYSRALSKLGIDVSFIPNEAKE